MKFCQRDSLSQMGNLHSVLALRIARRQSKITDFFLPLWLLTQPVLCSRVQRLKEDGKLLKLNESNLIGSDFRRTTHDILFRPYQNVSENVTVNKVI